MSANLYIDFHILQTVPPSCVNRDDTGSPKNAVYGGTTRARVSSQAWKHAMRLMFCELFKAEKLGKRTKQLDKLIADEITAIEPDADAEKLAANVLTIAGIKAKSKKEEKETLFFISKAQTKALAELAMKGCSDKKACKAALLEAPSVDISLFGRMVANAPSLNFDAAAQVAHSISTHTVHNEYDYFTAVDDCKPDDNAGAAHLGTVEFASSTLYRYATVNVIELAATAGDDAAAVVRGFAEAFVKSMPTGKQNTFANRTLPDCVYVTLRNDQPVNLCGAFEKPVPASAEGYVAASEKRLRDYAEKVYGSFAPAPVMAFCAGDALPGLAKRVPLTQLLDELETEITKALAERGVTK